MNSFEIVNAFTQERFGGNPAAVVPLDAWPPDATLQALANQFNLSETAFFVPREAEGEWDLRFFTPQLEVDLCGHATLASADVLFRRTPKLAKITFGTKAGPLVVSAEADGSRVLDLPARPVTRRRPDVPGDIFGYVEDIYEAPAGGNEPVLLVTFQTEEAVRACQPDLARLAALPFLGAIISAPGREVDFVSRFFAPRAGIAEDPVTGAAHCTLGPFWADRFGQTRLTAQQLSARVGDLRVMCQGERVHVAGRAVPFAAGVFETEISFL